MATNANKCQSFKYTTTSVATATWTKLLSANDRDHLLLKWDGTNSYQVFFKGNNDTAPSAATDGDTIDTNYKGDFDDWGFVPVCEVWVYQATGGNINIKAREGSAQDRFPA